MAKMIEERKLVGTFLVFLAMLLLESGHMVVQSDLQLGIDGSYP
jgi:hypothetical protein